MATTGETSVKRDHMFAKLEGAAESAHLRPLPGVPAPRRVGALLNRCIEGCTDSEKTYAIAATNVRDVLLRAVLHDQSKRRGILVGQLQSLLTSLGRHSENDGSRSGALRRGWMDLRIIMGARSDRSLLAECERADIHALAIHDVVRQQLMKLGVPPWLTRTLEAQRAVLFAGHSEITGILLDGGFP